MPVEINNEGVSGELRWISVEGAGEKPDWKEFQKPGRIGSGHIWWQTNVLRGFANNWEKINMVVAEKWYGIKSACC